MLRWQIDRRRGFKGDIGGEFSQWLANEGEGRSNPGEGFHAKTFLFSSYFMQSFDSKTIQNWGCNL